MIATFNEKNHAALFAAARESDRQRGDKMTKTLDNFTQAYIECALWADTAYGSPEETRVDPNHEGRFDRSWASCGYTVSRGAERLMARDCEAFQRDNADLLAKWYSECGETEERAGHDFWLTRNGHGAGFWDRWNSGTPQGEIGSALTDAAHAYGGCSLMYSRGRAVIA